MLDLVHNRRGRCGVHAQSYIHPIMSSWSPADAVFIHVFFTVLSASLLWTAVMKSVTALSPKPLTGQGFNEAYNEAFNELRFQ